MLIFPLPQLGSLCLGYLWPIYATYKVVKCQRSEELRYWLMYWSVFGTFQVCEGLLGPILYFIPFYSLARPFFLAWLVLPQTRGATVLYRNYIHPHLATHERTIDSMLDQIRIYLLLQGSRWRARLMEKLGKSELNYFVEAVSKCEAATEFEEISSISSVESSTTIVNNPREGTRGRASK